MMQATSWWPSWVGYPWHWANEAEVQSDGWVAWVLSVYSIVSNCKCIQSLPTCYKSPFWLPYVVLSTHRLVLHHFCIIFLSTHRNRDFIESLLCLFIIAKCCPLSLVILCNLLRCSNGKISSEGVLLGHITRRNNFEPFSTIFGGFYHL